MKDVTVAIECTDHAVKQMARRGITLTEVEFALKRETKRTPGAPGTIWIWGHATGSRILKVCVPADNEQRVITAAWPDE